MNERKSRRQWKRELIMNELRQLVVQLPPGSCLPSENAMAARFKTARMTASLAFQMLEKENLIERHRGSGSFVKGKRTITFLLPTSGFLSLFGHDEGIIRMQLEGIRRAACEHGLTVETMVASSVNRPEMINVRQLEHLDSSSMVIVSPWYVHCFRILLEHRCRVAWITNQSSFNGYHSYIRDWFKLEADRLDAMREIIRYLYQAGSRKIALASAHISGRVRRKNGICKKRKPEYDDLQLISIKLPYSAKNTFDDSRDLLKKALQNAHRRYCFDGLVLDTSISLTGRNIHEFCGLPQDVQIFGLNIIPEQCRLDEPFAIAFAPYDDIGYDAVETLLNAARKGYKRRYSYIFQNMECLFR